MAEQQSILRIKDVSKSFSGVSVLSKVNLDIRSGEVHALMGENGAGKSTLMKIIMGIYKSDGGEVFFNAKRTDIKGARDALNLGISMIHQELNPIAEMTVAENVFIGREIRFKGTALVNKAAQNRETQKLLEKYGMAERVAPAMKMKQLSIAQIQMMEIIKAISYNAKVIIMDEPTSSLSEKEADELFRTIGLLKQTGVGIIYISHRMEEVFVLADRISVLRDGEMIGCIERADVSREKIINMMVGRALSSGYPRSPAKIGDAVLSVQHFSKAGVFEDVSFSVHAGEILGFAGLVGAGRSEVMRALVGYDKKDAGTVEMDAAPITIRHPSDAKRHHITMASEDRKALGLILCRNIKENISIQNENQYAKAGFMNHRKERNACNEIARRVTVKMNGISDEAGTLSGGNQQKVVLAKCLLSKPRVIILDEPTRGIDVGAKAEIYAMMNELAQKGIAIIMISSEMPELIGMSDRILVMAGGRLCGEFKDVRSTTQEDILKLALGGI
ncbi:MAG: sugar ABC transporter ATP-binding protein [Clostridia bacterium]